MELHHRRTTYRQLQAPASRKLRIRGESDRRVWNMERESHETSHRASACLLPDGMGHRLLYMDSDSRNLCRTSFLPPPDEAENEELYADSAELMKMRSYLDEKPVPQTEVRISEMEFAKLDEILLGNILKAVEDNLSETEFDVQHLAEKSTCHAPH